MDLEDGAARPATAGATLSRKGEAMWRELWNWIKRLAAFEESPGHPGIRPHPPLGSDRGERDQIEHRMEMDSMHAGFRR